MNAFITGANRGIGRGIARVLADAGYDIAFTYGSAQEEAKEAHAEITAKGSRCFYYQASLENPDVPAEVTRRAISDLGGIDAVICNAALSKFGTVLDGDISLLDYLYALNYRAYILCAREAAKDMIARKSPGNIVFISSTRGDRAYAEDTFYGAMKAALHLSAQSMALELAKHNIRVNSAAPGATEIRGDFSPEQLSRGAFAKNIPLGRRGSPDEVGHLVKYIISPEAGYMTGNIIKLDGGLILPGMPESDELYERLRQD
ncbi:MAG: SDR family oxidoreductase [Oscillospiraceae bacterium]|nr:SDR family oxidoreductase [Oscillospiraceae bacterium]